MRAFFRSLALTAAVVVTAPAAFAQQLPNADFEAWATRTTTTLAGPVSYPVPQGWEAGLISYMQMFLTGQAPGLSRATTAHSGTSALRLKAPTADSLASDALYLAPYSAQASALIGHYQVNALPSPGREPSVEVVFYKNGNGLSGGSATLTPSAAGVWESFTIPFNWVTGQPNPDSLMIMLLQPGDGAATTPREVLFDDFDFVFLLGTPEAGTTTAAVTVQPTVVTADQTARLSFTAPRAGQVTATITDAVGRVAVPASQVVVSAGPAEIPLPAAALPPGLYWATLTLPDGTTRRARFVQQ